MTSKKFKFVKSSDWLVYSQGSHAPWKSLNFKINIQGLEKSLKIAVGAGKSLNLGANFVQPGFSSTYTKQIQKDLQDKIAHVVEELKKTDSRIFVALNGVLEKWEMCPWKSLNFFVQKKVRTLYLEKTKWKRSSGQKNSPESYKYRYVLMTPSLRAGDN